MEYLYNGIMKKYNTNFIIDEYEPINTYPSKIDYIEAALQKPIDYKSLKDFLKPHQSILIIVNDATRNTPTKQVLTHIQSSLNNKNCTYIVALGSHPNPSENELIKIFGSHLSSIRNNVIFHDCHSNILDYYGTTSRNNNIFFNHELAKADAVIVIGSCEPHYFAGFTGGRKSFLPGIAGYSSIENNHELALDENSSILKLNGNPVHEDMIEATGFIQKPVFSIQTVLNSSNQIVFAASGNLHSSFNVCTQMAKEIYRIKTKKQYDIIITELQPPLDDNLYQAHKGIENCKQILKPGGICILLASCHNGIGNDNFYKLLASSMNLDDVKTEIKNNYVLGYHKASKLTDFIKNHKLWIISELNDKEIDAIFAKPFCKLSLALEKALSFFDTEPEIAFIHNAGITVMVLDRL